MAFALKRVCLGCVTSSSTASFMSASTAKLRREARLGPRFSANGTLPPANADRLPADGAREATIGPAKADEEYPHPPEHCFMICPKCQASNPEPAENCLHCGFGFAEAPKIEIE